ncbi:MAG: MGDG synthase family glycosyltransferase [Candidatus Aminicenantia bacterium]
MGNRILIAYASAGGGHLSASKAIEQALKKIDSEAEIEIVDVLSFTPFLFRLIYAKGYLFLANRIPTLWGILFTAREDFSNISRGGFFYRFLLRIIARKFIKYFLSKKPDCMIFTHFLPAKIMVDIKEKNKLDFLTALCITDYGIHSIWITPGIDLYFLPAEQMLHEITEYRKRIGTKLENFIVTGIPIELKYLKEVEKKNIFESLSFSEDFPVILFYAGLLHRADIQRIISHILHPGIPYQLIVVVGKKRRVKERIEKFLKNSNDTDLKNWKVFEFVNNMEELLSISSIILTKAGGLITTEAIYKGVIPFLIENYPGQEERNADFLLEEGVAIKINHYSSLKYKILKILKNPEKLNEMKEREKSIAKGDSAIRIAEKIYEILNKRKSQPY